MSVPGAKCAISKAMIIKAIKSHRGCVAKAARGLRISRCALQHRIDHDEELLKLVHETRHEYDQMQLDEAEDVVMYALQNRKRDNTNACKMAIYVLNNKGKSRGFRRGVDDSDDDRVIGTLHKIKQVLVVDREGRDVSVITGTAEEPK